MAKNSGNTAGVEAWTVNKGTKKERVVAKITVRNSKGQFHGATNFRGSVVG